MSFDNIPDELRFLEQWVCWKSELSPQGKPTKVPYRSKGKSVKASTTSAETWGSFRNAVRRVTEYGDMDGIGFVFTENDPYLGIDVDGLDDGDPYGMEEFVDQANTYAEISPSGDGIHLIGRAKLPIDTGKHPKGVGLFEKARFFTFTGNLLDGEMRPIRDIQSLIDNRWPVWFPDADVPDPAPMPDTPWFSSDEDVVEKLRSASNGAKFEALFGGDITGYPSQSEADVALCSLITFYTQDRDQIARIFGHSGLARDKWLRSSYREATINRALKRSEFYQPTNTEDGVTIILKRTPSGAEMKVPVFNTTDLGNSMRLAHHFGESIRYNHTAGSWMIWDGTRWEEDRDGGIMRIVVNTIKTIWDEAEAVESDDLKKTLKGWAIKSETEGRMSAAEKVARNHDGVHTTMDKYDTNPYLLNVLNGTINLQDGSFRPHERSDLITKLAPVEYRPGATCPVWEAFLHTVFAGDEELISFVQRAVGYSLTGDVSERALFILYGSGRNGKSTLTETISRIMGDYATTSSSEMIAQRKGDNPMATDLARLLGVRFTSAAETGEYSRMDESKVKMITGGDTIVAERKYRDPFTFSPEFKIWLSTNHQPNVRGVDEGIWDRIRLIPFSVRIPDEKVDRYLKDKLLKEASGILNWMVAGAVAWGEQGLRSNSAVTQATTEYRATMDTVGAFISEAMMPDPQGVIAVARIYQLYTEWAKESGEYAVSKRALTAKLRDRGFSTTPIGAKNVVSVQGLREPFASESGQVVRIKY